MQDVSLLSTQIATPNHWSFTHSPKLEVVERCEKNGLFLITSFVILFFRLLANMPMSLLYLYQSVAATLLD